MYWRFALNLIFIILLSIIQVAFVSALPSWFREINLVIIVLIFVLSLRGFLAGFWWAAGAALVFELFSFSPFGIYLFSLLLSLSLANFLLTNYFTNRSIYSYLALTIATLSLYEFLLYSVNYGLHYFLQEDFVLNFDKNFFIDKLEMILINAVVVALIFYVYNFISKNFQPVFIVRGKIKK